MIFSIRLAPALAVILLLSAAVCPADVVRLKNGQTWEGTIQQNRDGQTALKLSGGITVYFKAEEIQEIIKSKPKSETFKDIRSKLPDDAESHYQLALWCEENGMKREMRQELQRVIELDPEHSEARQRLGYTKTEEGWVSSDDLMRSTGYVLYKGKWMRPEAMERKKDAEFKTFVGRLFRQATSSNPAVRDEAIRELASIEDPLAGDVAEKSLGASDEHVRVLAAKMLARLGSPEAVPRLVDRLLVDESAALRGEAMKSALALDRKATVNALIEHLRSRHLSRRRRAATALGMIGDTAAVEALAATLYVKTRRESSAPVLGTYVQSSLSADDDVEIIMLPGLEGGVVVLEPVSVRTMTAPAASVIGSAPRYVPVEEALESLKLITGEDFGYDRRKWLSWWGNQKLKEAANPRKAGRIEQAEGEMR